MHFKNLSTSSGFFAAVWRNTTTLVYGYSIAELIETNQFPEAGFTRNEQVRYRHRSRIDHAPFERLQTEIRFAGG